MEGSGPAAGAPVAVATLPSRGLPRGVQFSVQNESEIELGSLRAVEGTTSGPIHWFQRLEIVDVPPPGGARTPWGTSRQASGSSASLRPFG